MQNIKSEIFLSCTCLNKILYVLSVSYTHLDVYKRQELIHWSERDGWAHLYLYDAQGNLKNRITKGPWHVGHRRRGQ